MWGLVEAAGADPAPGSQNAWSVLDRRIGARRGEAKEGLASNPAASTKPHIYPAMRGREGSIVLAFANIMVVREA